jgi:Tripartite tricarboxylate transporter family receptor
MFKIREPRSWFGIVAPKSTSTEIINVLHDEINAIVADPKMKAQLGFWHIADVPRCPIDVRYWGQSEHEADVGQNRLLTKSGQSAGHQELC